MKRTLVLTALLAMAGPALARGPDFHGPFYRVTLGSAATQPAAQKQYTCPMHREVVSDQPGKCPKCGMNLVERKADTDAAKPHDHNHGETK